MPRRRKRAEFVNQGPPGNRNGPVKMGPPGMPMPAERKNKTMPVGEPRRMTMPEAGVKRGGGRTAPWVAGKEVLAPAPGPKRLRGGFAPPGYRS